MKGKTLIIWIILLNVFDCSFCLTTVWIRKLLLDPDTPLSYSPHTPWKFQLRFRQPLDRVPVGYENVSRKLRQTEKDVNQIASAEAILPSRSKRHADDISKKEDDVRKQAALKRDRQLSLESFTGKKSESDLTQFGLLKETTKLDRGFLQAAFSNDTKTANSTIDKTVAAVSRDSLNNSNANDTKLRTQLPDKNFGDRSENKSGNYNSSTSPISSRDNRIIFISSSTSVKPNLNWDKTTALIIRANITSKQGKTTSLVNTKPFAPSYQTVNLTMEPSRTSTTIGRLIRRSGQPSFVSRTVAPTDITSKTVLMPKVVHNSITSHKTTRSKGLTSTLRTSATDTRIITTLSTDVESTASSSLRGFSPQAKTIHSGQTTYPETTSTSIQKSTEYHRSTVTTSPSQTPTTKTTRATTRATTIPTSTRPTTTIPPTTRPLTTTTKPTSTRPPTTIPTTTIPTTTKATTTTHPVSSELPNSPTMTSKIATATSESSTRSSRLSTPVITSTETGPEENTTISNSSASTNTSTNPTLGKETTTFISHSTDKNVAKEKEDDAYFWPLVLSFVIGIPAIIVFSIAMVVILKKRNIDSSTFFISAPFGDEEV